MQPNHNHNPNTQQTLVMRLASTKESALIQAQASVASSILKVCRAKTRAAIIAILPYACVAIVLQSAMTASGGNLLVNPGAETAAATTDWNAVTTIPGWTVTAGEPSIASYSTGVPPLDSTGGNSFFACGPYGNSTIVQIVDVSPAGSQIDGGSITYNLSGWLGGWGQYNGYATVTAAFLDGSDNTLGTGQISGGNAAQRHKATGFLAYANSGAVPVGTRSVLVIVQLFNDPASYNVGYADNLSLTLSATGLTAASLTAPVSTVPAFDHVFIIMQENTDYEEVIGNANAPFINGLANMGTLMTAFSGTYHPSDENYLSIAGGDTFVQGAIYFPNIHVTSQHLGDALEAVGKTWKAYEQGMGTPGNLTNNYDTYYAPDDAPFVNFTNVLNNPARLQAHLFDTSQMTSDFSSASTTPNFAWIAADDYYDGEASGNGNNTSLAVQDGWLKTTIQLITNSPAWSSERCLLILTWDESMTRASNHIATILIGSQGLVRTGYRINTIMNHYSTGRTIENALGLPAFTANDQYAEPINDAFTTGGAMPSVTANPTTVAAGGTVTVQVANGPGNAMDWVGLYTNGAPDSPSLAWQYLNGSQTPPSSGLTDATLTFTMPATAGQYEFRFFANNGYTRLATSGPVTVTGSAPPAPTGLTATAGTGQVMLAWNASSGAASYNIYAGTSSGGETFAYAVTGVTSSTVTGLASRTKYYFKITAVNSHGESAFSSEVSARTK